MKKSFSGVFLREKPVAILNVLKNSEGRSYTSDVARGAGCTYAHAHKLLLYLEEHGLVSSEKESRRRITNLTEKGNQVAEHISKLKEILE